MTPSTELLTQIQKELVKEKRPSVPTTASYYSTKLLAAMCECLQKKPVPATELLRPSKRVPATGRYYSRKH